MKLSEAKGRLKKVPVVGPASAAMAREVRKRVFPGSASYWEGRYAAGGTSGGGSYGPLAQFKADTLNAFVQEQGIRSVIEFGCGDGSQLALASYPSYIGLDVAPTAIHMCQQKFSSDQTKSFFLYRSDCFTDNSGVFSADLSLSLDVIYHLIEDDVFEQHLAHLFGASRRFVGIYSSDAPSQHEGAHERHRNYSGYVSQTYREWRPVQKVPNPHPYRGDAASGSLASFEFYERRPRS